MSSLSIDPGVYIRSMATRGFLGGMAKATTDAVKVLDAFGKDVIIIETVGVGQDEVDIIQIADTTCLILVPGLGDAIQSMKAGVMEIADVFVVNKADRIGADQLLAEVSLRIEQDTQIKPRQWTPPVVKTVAVEDQGVDELWKAIEQHRSHLQASGDFLEKRRLKTRQETLRMIHEGLFRAVQEHLQKSGRLNRIVEDILERRRDPYSTRREVLKDWLNIPEREKEPK